MNTDLHNTVLYGDALEIMRGLPAGIVQMCVTSPAYWGLRDYGVEGQLGLEPTPEEYVARLVEYLREVWRLLRDDGTLWLVLGDSYAGGGPHHGDKNIGCVGAQKSGARKGATDRLNLPGLKPKDLVGIPWRVAFALQADGWWLRSDIIWCMSGGAYVYAKTQKGEMPMTIKDLARLDPSTVRLWNGDKWTQARGWIKTARPVKPLEIVLRSGERIGCTPEHQWPTRRGTVRADELRIGDIIESCRLPEPRGPESPAHIPDDIGWFIGMFLAEGSRGKNKQVIQIASHVKEESRHKRLKAIAERYGGTCRFHKTGGLAATINIYSHVLIGVLEMYVGGTTAKDKHLKVRCWQRRDEFLRNVLSGYLAGDGHYDEANDRWRLGFTRNYSLEGSLRTLCARLGVQLRLKLAHTMLNGKKYPTFRGEIRFTKSDHHNVKQDGEVVAIRGSRARQFWDISVADEPHLFALASGVLTHNSKPNPMPESVTDRPTTAHEHVFLLAKGARYYYDADAIREEHTHKDAYRNTGDWALSVKSRGYADALPEAKAAGRACAMSRPKDYIGHPAGRNKRSVWEVATKPYPGAHFATFPPELIEPCILAGSSPQACQHCGAPWARVVERTFSGEYNRSLSDAQQRRANTMSGGTEKVTLGEQCYEVDRQTTDWQPTCSCEGNDGSGRCIVLDPFAGSGTTGATAYQHGRDFLLIELSEDYAPLITKRLAEAGVPEAARSVGEPVLF